MYQMSSEWMPMKQACDILGISLSTLRRRIYEGKIESKLDNNRRLVLIDIDTSKELSSEHMELSIIGQLKYQIKLLEHQLDNREKEVNKLYEELAQSRERSDTIILQLTRQLEQNHKLIEYRQEPWYRKWLKKKRNPLGSHGKE